MNVIDAYKSAQKAIRDNCGMCDGHGFTVETETDVESGHGCDGTDADCARVCPVPVQVERQVQQQCEYCGRPIAEIEKLIAALNATSSSQTTETVEQAKKRYCNCIGDECVRSMLHNYPGLLCSKTLSGEAMTQLDQERLRVIDRLNKRIAEAEPRAEHLEAENARLKAAALFCYVCGKPAACIANYEGEDHYQPACDEHCGHGNEDGWCRPPAEAVAEMSKWLLEANTSQEIETLKAHYRAAAEVASEKHVQLETASQEIERLKSELQQFKQRMFPIQGGPAIPWSVIAPCDQQARRNHSQSLERLAERGGLSPSEACDVLLALKWNTTPQEGATDKMLSIVRQRQANPRAEAAESRLKDVEAQLAAKETR